MTNDEMVAAECNNGCKTLIGDDGAEITCGECGESQVIMALSFSDDLIERIDERVDS